MQENCSVVFESVAVEAVVVTVEGSWRMRKTTSRRRIRRRSNRRRSSRRSRRMRSPGRRSGREERESEAKIFR